MAQTARILFWLLSCASFIQGNSDDISYIRGIPGEDYPNYSSIPRTSFRCSQQHHIPGLYADIETRCQVFHHCYEHRQESFLCPLGTVFNQAILACDYWYSADCSAAPLYYGSDSPHQALTYETESYLVPTKTSSDNLLDKMVSLYDEDSFVIPNDSENKADSLKGKHSFSDRDRLMIIQTKPVIENRNLIETTDHYGRHDIVMDELSGEYENLLNNEEVEDNIKYFEDAFEGSGQFSGESKEPEEEDSNLGLSNQKREFDNQHFAILYEEHVEQKTIPHEHSYNKDEPKVQLMDISYATHSSSNRFSEPGEKLVKRNSENSGNFYSRKSSRRKPLFSISEPQTEITTFELHKDKVSTSSIDPVDQDTISAPADSASSFPESPVTSYKSKRRRKPIVIDLEDSLQYNFDNTSHSDGGSNANYEVNPQSEMPGVSIATQEISVKLFPSEINRKHKPVSEYFFSQYNGENYEKIASSSASYVTSPAPNMDYESTFPTFNKEFEIIDAEFPVEFNRINPMRKKNKIPVIDSDDNHFGIDDNHLVQFGDKTLPQPVEKEFQNFEDHLSDKFEETKEIREQEVMPEVFIKDVGGENDSSYFITEHDILKLNTNGPDTYDILQETQQDRFDLTTYEEIQYEKYFTTTEPNSDISTSLPLEIQNTEDSVAKFRLVPHFNFESEFDHSGISKNIWTPVPVTVEGNHVGGQFDSGSFELNPSNHIFLEDSKTDETTELPHSKDVESQTIISESSENDIGMEHLSSTELKENILHNNSTSEDFVNNSYAHSGERSTTLDALLDAELQDYLSNSNRNSDFLTKLDANLTESKQTEDSVLEDVPEKQPLEIQRHLIDDTVDFDAVEKQEVVEHLELNPNSPQLKNLEPKVESVDIQGVIDLSNDFSETSSQLDSVSPVTSNSTSETSENPPFWNHIKTHQNVALNSTQKFSDNVGMKADLSQDIHDNQLKTNEKTTVNEAHSISLPTNQGSMKNYKKIPSRNARAFTSPYQMNFNTEAFGSQYLAGFPNPSSVLKLKQSHVQKLFPYSGHAFYARTGSYFESPKISKLISFGKNLLRSKRAKFRIFSKYVKSNL